MKTHTETEVIDANVLYALTYEIFEGNACGLHMAIFKESADHAELVDVMTNISPRDIKKNVEDTERYAEWDETNEGPDEDLLDDLREKSRVVQRTEISDFGYCRTTHWGEMNSATRKAFAWMDEKLAK